jgi:hypothetical protein
MGLVISKGLTLRKGWQPMDPDAAAYITAVETADGHALEEKTKIAIDNFVLGCKADGIWNAIKASCILAGARTRIGALTPLVGAAPTSFNFVDGDYNRKTGLVGDGSTKYLNSNYAIPVSNSANLHVGGFYSVLPTTGLGATGAFRLPNNRGTYLGIGSVQAYNSGPGFTPGNTTATGFRGISRASSANYFYRSAATLETVISNSVVATHESQGVFAVTREGGTVDGYSNHRLAFYSIGESLDLALLDARVTDLINAFGAAIP